MTTEHNRPWTPGDHGYRPRCRRILGDDGHVIAQLYGDFGTCMANGTLYAAAPELYEALAAQEIASEMQLANVHPEPDDPRYTPYIGEWDGYQAPELRYRDFMLHRREMRSSALAKANPTQNGGG